MKKLLTLSPSAPKNFSTKTDLAGWFNDLPAGRSHNVVVVCHCCWLYSRSMQIILANLLPRTKS